MKTYKYILSGILIMVFSFSFSQKAKIRMANDTYDKFHYFKTTDILLEVANDGYKSVELFQKLANSYYFNSKMEDAAKWYGELMAMGEPVDPEYYFRYAQALKTIENYTESDKWMKKFYLEKTDDLRGRYFISTPEYLSEIDDLSREDIEVKNLDLNSALSDFGTTQYKNQLIFASTRGNGRDYKWNEQPYLDLYVAQKQEDGSYGTVDEMNNDINTKYHESSAAFTPDDKYMFFTRNNYYNKKYKKDEEGTNRLKIFRAIKKENGDWGDITPVHFNDDSYSVAHPSINKEGTKMYFASDMPGTNGLSDIYVVDINEDRTLGTPSNLGTGINTQGQESFPFINENGDLYFSSNSYPGLGGLDIYVVRGFEEGYFNTYERFEPENIGRPINSPNDDFAYFENLKTKEGFFTSNREGGKGDDDIYSFIAIEECKQLLEGVIKNRLTDEIIPESTVTLFDNRGNEIASLIVGADALFSFEIECDTEYLIRGEIENFIADEQRFTTPSVKQDLKLQLLLDKDEQQVVVGDDLAKMLDIPIIYFDFDKYNIRYDASVELRKVLVVMKKYPTMEIDIRSHTDCRGPEKYNEELSDRRAKSTRQYLIDNGISEDRLTAKGYGESQLVNDCDCNSNSTPKCTPAQHQLNRRSEFIITKD
jgi:outer membrane protein OmpA-like peptidoglycan-associated protein